jgi:F-type H+-transporting ATPase subunit b
VQIFAAVALTAPRQDARAAGRGARPGRRRGARTGCGEQPPSRTRWPLRLLWPTANFIVLVVLLNKVLRAPIAEYLAARSSQIRKDLVDAAELNKSATAQLADVERKLQALPGELDALRTRGAQEIVAEEERIASAAAADRARLLTQTKREIEVRLQAAQRELSDHAATLALQLAEQKLATEMTAADHARLVDRYVAQVKER